MPTRTTSTFAIILLMLFVSPALAGPIPTTQPFEKHTPFVAALLRNWDKWDTDKNGILSPAEIDCAVLDPMVKGSDAAAAGTLKLMSRSKKITVPPLTRAYFEQYDSQALAAAIKPTAAAAENATTDTVASASSPAPVIGTKKIPINWDLYYVAGERRMSRGGKIIWPDKFNLDDMRQGPLGDCYFVGVVGSMVIHRPEEVQKLIQPLPDGGFHVTFPGAVPFDLRPLTDSELAISSTTSGDGIWLAAMEQAFGQYREQVKGMSPEEGTDTIADGGDCGPTMALLTGHKFKRIRMARTIEQRETKFATIAPLIRQELTSAIQDHRLIAASVNPPVQTPTTGPTSQQVVAGKLPPIPPDITLRHVYAVVSYDAEKDTLEMWNPHGQSFTPKGEAGLLNGYPTHHGRFVVPLKEAYFFFTSFTFELPVPTTQPAAMLAVPGK